MRQRQRQGSGAVIDPSRPNPPPTPAGAGRAPEAAHPPTWEQVFRSASPAQQQELLALAARQGVVYAHQLPATLPAQQAAAPHGAETFLTRILAGQTDDLEPLRIEPVQVRDSCLDAAQREAVARAVQTPDVFLLQGFPGTGKSRVVAEVVGQAAARGKRVLLLAPHPAGVDRVLELLTTHDAVCALRAVGPDEKLEGLPTHARDLTAAGHLRRLHEKSLPQARLDLEEVAARHELLARQEPLWPQLLATADERREVRAEAEGLTAARADVAARVEAEADAARKPAQGDETPFTARCREALRERDDLLAQSGPRKERLDVREGELKAEIETVTARLESLRPLAEAKESKRWWTSNYWRAAFQGDVGGEAQQLRTRLEKDEAELHAVEEERRRFAAEEEAARVRCDESLAALAAAEKTSRLAELDARAAALAQREKAAADKAESLCRELPAAPADLSAAGIEAARDAWLSEKEQAEGRLRFQRGWVDTLQRQAEAFVARLRRLCNVLATTTAAVAELPADGFDLLVLEGAERVTESELLRLARLARRWVLVGKPDAPSRPADTRRTPPPRLQGLRTPPADAWPAVFPKLWQHLHADPGRLPYAWLEENGRLCCRMRPLTPEQTQWLETERLADFPDIELRILTLPRAEPVLAEVVFPPTMSVAEAKVFVMREVQETAVHPRGRSVWWVEEPERVVLRLADEPGDNYERVPLDEGVCEHVRRLSAAEAPLTWQTCCVAFDRAAGWQRVRAEEWVRQHLNLRDLGRTMRLEISHRAEPDLARFLSDVLFRGELRPRPGTPATSERAAVEFVAVPPLHEPNGADRRNGGAAVAMARPQAAALMRKSGAGLELDLADGRSRDRLPTECRGGLPAAGLVNYLEAQAVVRVLESLAGSEPGPIGVVALYPAQADLIRLLVRQSPDLSALGSRIVIDTPDAFVESECPLLLVSLTRSHGHRPVPFGDDPAALALALTRPRRRLVLFGDAGTLARRSQHEQSVEHLDQTASARERDVLLRLVRYLQGQGAHPQSFQVREGSPA